MTKAPGTPTTEELASRHTLEPRAVEAIALQRAKVANSLSSGFMVGMGGCSAMEQHEPYLIRDASELHLMQELNPKISTVQRVVVWKPRTDKKDWHGEETTNPEGAYRLVTSQAARFGRNAMEVAFPYHMERYGNRSSFVWSGARNKSGATIVGLALYDPMLGFGVKNSIDGDIEFALQTIAEINSRRADAVERPAPAVLIWRGGSDYLTPEAWESQRQRAYELTEGQMIDDSAHGTSMAHDHEDMKSDYGQQAALEHIIELSATGYMSRGVLIEASDAKSITDPNLPFAVGQKAVQELIKLI